MAFLVAEGIAYVDLLYWARVKINRINTKYSKDDICKNVDCIKTKLEVYEKFISLLVSEKKGLYRYNASKLHDDFYVSEIIALMKNDYLKRDFDYLQFAISIFQWQEYTKKQHIYEIIKEYDFSIDIAEIVE